MPHNNYCVYLHRRSTDNTVFYIGSGVFGKRDINFSGRSKEWKFQADNYGVVVEIYSKDLSIDDARNIEKGLILSGNYPDIVNKRTPNEFNYIDIDKIKNIVKYDELSPTFLTWLVTTGSRSKAGHPAGSLTFNKEKARDSSIKLLGKMLKVSRVIWSMHNGEIPKNMIVDHIDGNPHNNNINNLRIVDYATNASNRSKSKDNDLPQSIRIVDGSVKVVAVCGQIKKSASFSIKRHGYDAAVANAISWKISTLKDMGCLDRYSERHIGVDLNNIPDLIVVSKCASGVDNIWTKYDSNGKPILLSAGFGKTNRRYVSINDRVTYEDALDICIKYLETLHNSK